MGKQNEKERKGGGEMGLTKEVTTDMKVIGCV